MLDKSCSGYEGLERYIFGGGGFLFWLWGEPTDRLVAKCTEKNHTTNVNHGPNPILICSIDNVLTIFAWPEPELGHEAASRFELEYLSGNSKASAIL